MFETLKKQSYVGLFPLKNFRGNRIYINCRNGLSILWRYIFFLKHVKTGSYIRYNRKIWLYKKAHIKLHKSCRLKIQQKDSLRLGGPWDPIGNNFYPVFFDTHFVAYKNSEIEIAGRVRIQTGYLFRILENAKLFIGKDVLFNGFGMVYCSEMIKVGNGVVIGPYLRMRDADSHHFEYPGYGKKSAAPIIIGDHVWIGLGVTILKGVHIGEGCVIVAGSVVTKSIPSRCLAGGNPAKVLRENVTWR